MKTKKEITKVLKEDFWLDRVSIFERDEGLIAPGNRFFHRVPLQHCRSEQKEPEHRLCLTCSFCFVALTTNSFCSSYKELINQEKKIKLPWQEYKIHSVYLPPPTSNKKKTFKLSLFCIFILFSPVLEWSDIYFGIACHAEGLCSEVRQSSGRDYRAKQNATEKERTCFIQPCSSLMSSDKGFVLYVTFVPFRITLDIMYWGYWS